MSPLQRLSRIEKAVIVLDPPSEVYERGSGDQSRSPPSSRLVLSEDRRFARSVPAPLQSARLDRGAETQFVSSCGDLRDSSRGLFSTGYHIPRSIRVCRVDFMFRCAPYRWVRGWHTCLNVALFSLVDFEFWSRSGLPLLDLRSVREMVGKFFMTPNRRGAVEAVVSSRSRV